VRTRLFGGLETIFKEARRLEDAGTMQMLSMHQAAQTYIDPPLAPQ